VCTAVLLFVCAVWLNAQNAGSGDGMKDCPMHAQKSSEDGHHAAVETNGDAAMGFSHEKTTHHFRLAESGGAIEVTANDAKDAANIDAIRMHIFAILRRCLRTGTSQRPCWCTMLFRPV
jgi:hypothetical protein